MGLITGLEKFGFGKSQDFSDITLKSTGDASGADGNAPKAEPTERDFLMDKNVVCPVCDRKFKILAVRGTKLRRLDPDPDLRPRYAYVDVLKYDTIVCPNCGYAAMTNYYEPISHNQIKRLKEQVMARFRPLGPSEKPDYTYEEAIERYKLCLMSAMVKNVRLSEKAYICLKAAWLYRDLIADLSKNDPQNTEKIEDCKEQFDAFYKQAYEGFSQALRSESTPMCGMKADTVEYLLANMAVYFDERDTALRYLSSLIISKQVPERLKNKCRDLKEQLLAKD